MNKTYIVSVDSMRAIEASSQAEAIAIAKNEFIEMIQRDEADIIVTEEIEDISS